MDEISKKYIELLCEALQKFYKNDAGALFGSEVSPESKVVNERAMTGCIYRYVWCLRHQSCYAELEPDVDIEYDRMTSTFGEFIEKGIVKCNESEKCSCGKECWQKILKEKERCRQRCERRRKCHRNPQDEGSTDEGNAEFSKSFRPDLILHTRDSLKGEGNGMIVEFKKKGDTQEEANSENIAYDKAKVMFCTCQKADFKYIVGAFVILRKDKCVVTIYQNGKEAMIPFCVCEKDSLYKVPLLRLRCANG